MNIKEALDCLGVLEYDDAEDLRRVALLRVSTGVVLADIAYIRRVCEAYVTLLCESGYLPAEEKNSVLEEMYANIDVQSIDQVAACFRDEVMKTHWF